MSSKSRIAIRGQGLEDPELEVDATVFHGRVCISFKQDGSSRQRKLADELRRTLHEERDPSIVQSDKCSTMNTRFPTISEMLEFLRNIGYKCREFAAR